MTAYLMSGLLTAVIATSGTAASAVPAAAAAPAAAQKGAKASPPPKDIRLNGCIERDRTLPGRFTFEDSHDGGKYRLTGKNLKKFVGHRVEIVGGPPGKGITFRTGLVPSPNIAAQAGALDPAKVAIANMPGGAADAAPPSLLPEFRVIRLRDVEGGCR